MSDISKAGQEPFWRTTTLEDMSDQQWESLCDGCGRCCLIKLEDEDTGRIHYTDVGCRLLDGDSCRCSDYPNRQTHVPDCVRLTPANVRALSWLPPTCAYRLVREGLDLPWWHPLVSGDPETVVAAGISVRGRLGGSEQDMEPEDLVDRIVQWPDRVPRKARAGKPPAGAHKPPAGPKPPAGAPKPPAGAHTPPAGVNRPPAQVAGKLPGARR